MDQPTSPFAGKPIGTTRRPLPPFVTLPDGEQVPTELQAYCDWLNERKFWGRWHFVVEASGEMPRRVEVMHVDEATWKANKARRYQGRLSSRDYAP